MEVPTGLECEPLALQVRPHQHQLGQPHWCRLASKVMGGANVRGGEARCAACVRVCSKPRDLPHVVGSTQAQPLGLCTGGWRPVGEGVAYQVVQPERGLVVSVPRGCHAHVMGGWGFWDSGVRWSRMSVSLLRVCGLGFGFFRSVIGACNSSPLPLDRRREAVHFWGCLGRSGNTAPTHHRCAVATADRRTSERTAAAATASRLCAGRAALPRQTWPLHRAQHVRCLHGSAAAGDASWTPRHTPVSVASSSCGNNGTRTSEQVPQLLRG